MAEDKLSRLEVYAASLKQRLAGPIPAKHASNDDSKAAFKRMIESDLKKTQDQILRLKGV